LAAAGDRGRRSGFALFVRARATCLAFGRPRVARPGWPRRQPARCLEPGPDPASASASALPLARPFGDRPGARRERGAAHYSAALRRRLGRRERGWAIAGQALRPGILTLTLSATGEGRGRAVA